MIFVNSCISLRVFFLFIFLLFSVLFCESVVEFVTKFNFSCSVSF